MRKLPECFFPKAIIAATLGMLLLLSSVQGQTAQRQTLHGHVPSATAHLRPGGNLPLDNQLQLAISLPLNNEPALTNLLQDLYDPSSTNYHHYLQREEFTAKFCPTEPEYEKVAAFARAHGLKISQRHANRQVLDVIGSVANIQEAFGVNLRVYQHPTENRTFFAPDAEPSVDVDLSVLSISGLDNYTLPHPNMKYPVALTNQPQEIRSYATGSGPNSDFIGNDFRAAYVPGVTNTGAGQVIGLFEFGSFSSNSIFIYETNAHLSTNIVVTPISVGGFNTAYSGQDDGEECLDIEMAISMAPDAVIRVYEGNNGVSIFNQIASENLAKQISCSFGFSPLDPAVENIFKEYAAQGQSCYIASGDSGAEVGPIFPPGDDPYATIVGGTSLTTSSPGGPWQSETTWIGSSGGVSTKYAIPSWQQGINMVANQGSTAMRNVPDVAMMADTDIFLVFKNGQTTPIGGTSAAAPLWAGFTALANQQAASQGKPSCGFINPAIYALGKGVYSTYASRFHDILTGNNFNSSSPTKFAATTGYDLSTGWGSPSGINTINFLAGTGTNDFTLYASQVAFTLVPGGKAASIITVFPIAAFSGNVNFTTANLPRGVTVSLSPASTATTSLLAITTATNAAIGTFNIPVTGTSGALSHVLTINLTIAPPIPGAAQVNLASAFNKTGIYTDGSFFSGGIDGDGFAYSGTLMGNPQSFNNALFNLGPANAADIVQAGGQTIQLPAGKFTTLQLLGTAVNGSQRNQSFTVTYTDNSTVTFSANLSDWASSQGFVWESPVLQMPYRNSGNGTKDTGTMVTLYNYTFTLDQTKTVKSLTLPVNGNVLILAATLVNGNASASLASYFNRFGMYTDGATYTNPPTGGIDGGGASYSATLLGNAQTWSNMQFYFGPPNVTNVVSCSNQIMTLPAGNYSVLRMLATGVQGSQASQTFTVAYADSTTSTFVQSLSDWFTSQNFTGETKAVIMGHRNQSDGTKDNRTFNLYGYSFKLNSSKVLQSIHVPNNGNVIITAVSLVPNWQPTFLLSPFTQPGLNAGQPVSGTISTNASDLNNDVLTFSKTSGPTWLSIAANGSLSGTPANTDAGTNTFGVQVTDPGGLFSTAIMTLYVNGAPTFINDPFTDTNAIVGQPYSGTIATNATDPNNDSLTFAKVSGPAWLNVSSSGALSGTPSSGDAGTNTFTVSATDPGNLSTNATLIVNVVGPSIIPSIAIQGTNLLINWTGGVGPYQVQMTTDLANPNWQPIGTLTSGTSLLISPTNAAGFYRIVGQ